VRKFLGGENGWRHVAVMAKGLGFAQVIMGRKADAARILRRLEEQRKRRYIPAIYLGILSAALGDFDGAFAWLERAFEERADGLTLLNADPMSDGLRHDPRFEAMVRRIGFFKA